MSSPNDWRFKRLKFCATFSSGGTPSKDVAEFWNGTIPWVSPKDMKCRVIRDTEDHISESAVQGSATRLLHPETVLVVVRSGILQHSIPVAVTAIPVTVNQDIKAIQTSEELRPGYLAYFIEGEQHALLLAWRKQGATVESIELELLANTEIPLPPIEVQSVVVSYLDRETARIDALVEKKQRLIALLEEKRAALINRAVTKGLDPRAAMKDSGSIWFGTVPAHWRKFKLGYLVEMVSGATPDKGNSSFWEGTIPWVSAKDMKVRVLGDSEDHISEEALAVTGLRLIRPPVVLIVVRGMILAHTIPVALTSEPLTINQDMKALVPTEDCSPRFLVHLLSGMSRLILALVEDSAHGTKCLRTDRWKGLEVFLPCREEQERIACWIDSMQLRFNQIITATRTQIDRLQEYRAALISAAVTGKIDVRGAIAEQPWSPD